MAEAKRSEIVDVPFDKFFQTILDFEAYPKFVTGVNQASVLSTSEAQLQVSLELEMIKKLHYTIDVQHSCSESSAELSWTLVESDLLNKNVGRWELLSKGPDQTEVTYSLDVEFKIPVPGLILRGLIKKSLPQAIKEFYQETKRRV